MFSMETTLILTPILGLLIGFLIGLTGAGGGILSVPVLIFFLHLTMAQAGPIALLAIASSAGIGALLAHKNKTLRYKAAALMALSGLTTAPIGLWLAHQLPNQPLVVLFGFILIILAIRFFWTAQKELIGSSSIKNQNPPCLLNNATGKLIWTAPCFWTLLLIGAISGFLSGLLGVGGGFIIVPALKRFTNLSPHSVIHSSLGVMSIIAIGSVGVSAVAGTLIWPIALLFSLGSIGGLLISRKLAQGLNPLRIQQFFAVFTFLVGIYMLTKSFLNL